MPWSPDTTVPFAEPYERINAEAQALHEHRSNWLNAPDVIREIAGAVDSGSMYPDVADEPRRLIRELLIAESASADPRLQTRTLTNLYNARPTWLRLAHERLDRAVLAAYMAVDPAGVWDEDWAAVWVETGAGRPLDEGHELSERRREVDERVLSNLLRMNLSRSAQG